MFASQILLISWAGFISCCLCPFACNAGDDCLRIGAGIRDKSWTTGSAIKSIGSQVEPVFALTSRVSFGAERMGFEPMVGCDTHTDLANRRFRPLSHLSDCRFCRLFFLSGNSVKRWFTTAR